MKKWPRYPECTVEQRRALWALDARERRTNQRWREMVVLTDPTVLGETITADHQSTVKIERDQIDDNLRASEKYHRRTRKSEATRQRSPGGRDAATE